MASRSKWSSLLDKLHPQRSMADPAHATVQLAQRVGDNASLQGASVSFSNTLGIQPCELPIYWNEPPSPKQPSQGTRLQKAFRGWRLLVLGTWLNIFLVFIPIAAVLVSVKPKRHGLIFTSCMLAMLPLVKLHDIATRDLANRIGGSRTGLLNASMSNVVSIVVAVSALRNCQLRVVQSSLIGAMLSKLLLVLGLCFFAGGLKFTEQGFDVAATQLHSSLLSISVGAVLLPAAYHFALSGGSSTLPITQLQNILHMSHGVSLILLLIYAAYLLFQLWSHPHLYQDQELKSNKLSLKVPDTPKLFRSEKGKNKPPPVGSCLNQSEDSPSSSQPPQMFYSATSASTSADVLTLRDVLTEKSLSDSKLDLKCPTRVPASSKSSLISDVRTLTLTPTTTFAPTDESPNCSNSVPDSATARPTPEKKEPQLAWPITILSLLVLTIGVALMADWLVKSMDFVSHTISKEWVSLILLPTVNALAECSTAVSVSVQDQMTMSISVAVGSSIQTALFVIPFTVTLAWTMGLPLSLLMDPFESLVLYIAVQTMSYIVQDGKSNWLEGFLLICLYIIIAVSFWFYPESELPEVLATCVI